MDWSVRRAVPDDADAWARCHRACWREAYGPIVDAALLEAALGEEGSWTPRVRERLSLPPGPRSWVAVDGSGDVIGLAVVGPSRGDLADLTAEQLYAIYVREAWHGTGLAQALLARSLGTAAACLEVLEDNARARAFYARQGFEPTGTRQLFERLSAWEVVLRRPAQHTIRPATQEQVRGEVTDSVTSVIGLDGRDVGRLRVVRTDADLELGGLQLLPSYRGRGIGGAILRELMSEAEASGRRFVVSVEGDNPRARAFYESHDLHVVEETGSDFVMVRR
jgi:ribosomal protein S18 acetylase RimI-like enzyme